MRHGFSILAAALFVGGFGGVLYGPTIAAAVRPQLASLGLVRGGGFSVPDCDASTPACRTRLRGLALTALEGGRGGEAEQLLRPAAASGDVRAMFFLGWAHEEAYRALVGKQIRALAVVPEEMRWTPETLGRDESFEEAVKQVENLDAPEPERRRRLAWLWYMRAAIDGFAPAMNNLGAMYQFGLMGPRDRSLEEEWYQHGTDAGNPVALLNLLRTWNRELRSGVASCEKILFWSEGNVRVVPAWRAEDMEDAVLKFTRFRGRMVPEPVRVYLQSGSRTKLAEIFNLAGILRPGVSQSEVLASQRALPEGWVFESDPDEAEAGMPRFAKTIPLREQAQQCRNGARRTAEADRYKLQRLRAMAEANAYNYPYRRRRW